MDGWIIIVIILSKRKKLAAVVALLLSTPTIPTSTKTTYFNCLQIILPKMSSKTPHAKMKENDYNEDQNGNRLRDDLKTKSLSPTITTNMTFFSTTTEAPIAFKSITPPYHPFYIKSDSSTNDVEESEDEYKNYSNDHYHSSSSSYSQHPITLSISAALDFLTSLEVLPVSPHVVWADEPAELLPSSSVHHDCGGDVPEGGRGRGERRFAEAISSPSNLLLRNEEISSGYSVVGSCLFNRAGKGRGGESPLEKILVRHGILESLSYFTYEKTPICVFSALKYYRYGSPDFTSSIPFPHHYISSSFPYDFPLMSRLSAQPIHHHHRCSSFILSSSNNSDDTSTSPRGATSSVGSTRGGGQRGEQHLYHHHHHYPYHHHPHHHHNQHRFYTSAISPHCHNFHSFYTCRFGRPGISEKSALAATPGTIRRRGGVSLGSRMKQMMTTIFSDVHIAGKSRRASSVSSKSKKKKRIRFSIITAEGGGEGREEPLLFGSNRTSGGSGGREGEGGIEGGGGRGRGQGGVDFSGKKKKKDGRKTGGEVVGQRSVGKGRGTSGTRNHHFHGISYAALLIPRQHYYNPFFLDNPRFKQGKLHTVMNLESFRVSIIPFVKPKKLKEEVNDQFHEIHPWIHHSLTLSKLRNLKIDLFDLIRILPKLDVSTVACAWVYFERLVTKRVVHKINRKLFAGACLVLSYKFNQEAQNDFMMQLVNCIQKLDFKENLSSREIFDAEFELYVEDVMPHIHQYLEAKVKGQEKVKERTEE